MKLTTYQLSNGTWIARYDPTERATGVIRNAGQVREAAGETIDEALSSLIVEHGDVLGIQLDSYLSEDLVYVYATKNYGHHSDPKDSFFKAKLNDRDLDFGPRAFSDPMPLSDALALRDKYSLYGLEYERS